MKKKHIAGLMIMVALIVAGTCGACLNAESKSIAESGSESKSTASIGDTTNNQSNSLKIDVKAPEVKTVVEAEVTIWEWLKSITDSWFFRGAFIVYSIMLFSGNLGPTTNFSLWDKKGTRDDCKSEIG